MNETPRKTTVSVEDLLRVKRAEQPPAAFWNQFEQGLRTKQLAAIVEPRPWWAPFIRIGARISRFQLPVGATAILAITLFTLREYQPASQNPTFEPVVQTTSVTTPVTVEGKASAVDATNTAAVSSTDVMAEEQVPVSVAVSPRDEQAAPATASAVGAASHVAMIDSELSSARYMADRLAAAQPSDSNLDQLLGRAARNPDVSSVPSEPLAQISMPGESRLYRLHGGVVQPASVGTTDSALRVNPQTARHLTERRLSEIDVVSRLDVGGNRLTVKF